MSMLVYIYFDIFVLAKSLCMGYLYKREFNKLRKRMYETIRFFGRFVRCTGIGNVRRCGPAGGPAALGVRSARRFSRAQKDIRLTLALHFVMLS